MIATHQLEFGADHPWWAWMLCALVAVLIVWWSVPPGRVSRVSSTWLMLIRVMVALLAMIIVAEPTWTKRHSETRPDVVAILLDGSASMLLTDETGGSSRFDVMTDAAHRLASESTVDRRVEWFRFANELQPIGPPVDGNPVLSRPDGGPTRIERSINDLLDQLSGEQVSGVVLMTDGRGEIGDVASRLRSISAGAWILPLGDRHPPPEVELRMVRVPRSAFSEDPIPVQVTLKRSHVDSGETEEALSLRVIDADREAVLAETTIGLLPGSVETRSLQVEPDLPGIARWRVELVHEDRVIADRDVNIDIRDRPMRMLYLEGKPRVLYRFIGPMFTRERSVEVSMLLQSADDDAAPDGNLPIRRVPARGDELDQYDLILIGDVDPRGFTQSQLLSLRDHVLAGAGLLWIPGSSVDPELWEGTALEPLLPVPADARRTVASGAIRSGDEATALGLAPPSDMSIDWGLLVDEQRPQARELMSLETDQGIRSPGLLLMPAGLGHVGWLSTDDMWRWRGVGAEDHGVGLLLGISRLLARQVQPDSPMLQVTPDPVAGRLITVVLEGVDEPSDAPLEVEVTDPDGVLREQIRLTPSQDGRSWRGHWQPSTAGARQLTLTGPDQIIRHGVDVLPGEPEDMRRGVDMDALVLLAEDSGGGILAPETLDEVLESLPNRQMTIETTFDEGPALAWWIWGAMISLLGLEWAVRRWIALA